MTIHSAPIDSAHPVLSTEAVKAWQDLLTVTPLKVRQAVAEVVRDGAETLTEEFYDRMQRSERATPFLDQERVQKRLRASLQRWMVELFDVEADLRQAILRQVEVGAVHARIRLPIDLIPAGIRVLKRGIRRRIDFAPLDTSDRLVAMVYVSDLLHLADGLMNQAYFQDAQEVVRNDEAYRLVTQKRTSSLERARQRAALSEWAENLLMTAWTADRPRAFPLLRESEFGIWLHHKGDILFGTAEEFRAVQEAISTMDGVLLPRLAEAARDGERTDAAVTAIRQLLDLIRFHLYDLFDKVGNQDDGLDIETRLPDRRYLPAILANEMRNHLSSGRTFCVLLIETQLPSLKGLSAAGTRSRLMQVAATTLIDTSRTSDHLFRFGDQRFLMIAVECDRAKATQLANAMAEELRNALQAGNVQGSWTPMQASVAIGIAEFDRHPDYQNLIQRAECALTEATSGNSRARIAFA